jgi:hypothetical protein
MKHITSLLVLSVLFSCDKEIFSLQQVAPSNNINAVVLSIDSTIEYSSINDDWFSIASNSTYNVTTKFYHNDSLGNITNLTNMVIDSNYFVKYELYPLSKSKITILDKTKMGGNIGLLFSIKTSTPEFGVLDVKLHNKKCDTIFHYKYPFIVSTP